MKSLSQRKSGGPDPAPEFQELIDEALEIRRDLIELTSESLDLLEHVHSTQRESAVNLLLLHRGVVSGGRLLSVSGCVLDVLEDLHSSQGHQVCPLLRRKEG